MILRIATYNVHRTVGRDGRRAPHRIAAVLGEINADVTALQEVTYDSIGQQNELDHMAQAAGAGAIAGPTLVEGAGRYGNAVLTRIAPDAVERLDISVPDREPRGALALRLKINGRTVKVVASHLGLRPGERRFQVQRLLTVLDKPAASLTIVLGDFNEWFSWARSLRRLTRRLGASPAPATFPSHRPVLSLDRIWVHPPERLVRISPHRSVLSRIASDHLPLVADVRV
jgi:endonuclease/exonuclease/phosphatase family metal-dependent hydrolase